MQLIISWFIISLDMGKIVEKHVHKHKNIFQNLTAIILSVVCHLPIHFVLEK